MEIKGCLVYKGELVMVFLGVVNWDLFVYEDLNVFDIERDNF